MEPIKLTSLLSASLVTLAVSYVPFGVAKLTPNPITTESGMAIVPFLNLSTGYNDNLAKSNQQQAKSAFSIIESGVGFMVEPEGNKTLLGYRFRNGTYFSSQQDNFTDHYLDLSSDWELNSRHRIGFEYNLALAHEGRGENDTTLGLDYNQYESHTANI
ncbi:exopolysaccharide biosynthesis beta-barrel protein VpsM, partial [Vibrio metoecus]